MSPSLNGIPHLVATEWSKQLVVHGKPFLMLAGELQNSSLTSAEYMDTVWEKMVDTNVNTLLGCVTWEMIEAVEGEFDFDELDKVILGARKHGLHLVLLWFGSFKNGTLPATKVYSLSTDVMQASRHTRRPGSRQTQSGSHAPSYARPGVFSRRPTCSPSSTPRAAKQTPGRLGS